MSKELIVHRYEMRNLGSKDPLRRVDVSFPQKPEVFKNAPPMVIFTGLENKIDDLECQINSLDDVGVKVFGFGSEPYDTNTNNFDHGAIRVGEKVNEVTENMHVEKLILTGHSLGGLYSIIAAADREVSDKLAALILSSVPAGFGIDDTKWWLPAGIDLLETATQEQYDFLIKHGKRFDSRLEPLEGNDNRRMAQCFRDHINMNWRDYVLWTDPNLPVIVYQGSDDGMSKRAGNRVPHTYPNATIVTQRGRGHPFPDSDTYLELVSLGLSEARRLGRLG